MRIAWLAILLGCGGSEPARGPERRPMSARATATEVTPVPGDAASSVDALDDRGWTPLMHAAQMGRLDEIADLLERGANIDADTDTIYDHATPLLIALEYSQGEAARLLLDRGANIAGERGARALALAARGGEMALVQHFLAHGAPASASALRLAARYGHAEVVTVLIAAGAPVDASDASDHHYTPLIVACQENKADAVAVLLAAGANVEATDDDGNTALYWAVFGSRPVEIHEYPSDDGPHDTYWIPQSDAPVVQLLVDAKAKVGTQNADGNTPLHEAAYLDAAAAAKVLLAAGAPRGARNKEGKTPHDIAKERHNSVEAVLAPKRR